LIWISGSPGFVLVVDGEFPLLPEGSPDHGYEVVVGGGGPVGRANISVVDSNWSRRAAGRTALTFPASRTLDLPAKCVNTLRECF